MKFKRFLALVVSLAMVLSFVPAFSLTASAGSRDSRSQHPNGTELDVAIAESEVKDLVLDSTTLVFDGSSTGTYGSATTDGNSYVEAWTDWQYFENPTNNRPAGMNLMTQNNRSTLVVRARYGATKYSMIGTLPFDDYFDSTTGYDYIVLTWYGYRSGNNGWYDVDLRDSGHKIIDSYCYAQDGWFVDHNGKVNNNLSGNGWNNKEFRIYIVNNSDNTYTTYFAYDGNVKYSRTQTGNIKNFAKLDTYVGGTGDLGYGDLKIYAKASEEDTTTITAKYVDENDNEIIKNLSGYTTVENVLTATGEYVVLDGYVYKVISEEAVDNTAVIEVTKYAKAASDNKFVNGDFEADYFAGWTSMPGNALSSNNFGITTNPLDNSRALNAHRSLGGSGTESSLEQKVNITGGKSYLVSMNLMGTGGNNSGVKQYSWFDVLNSSGTVLKVVADDTSGKFLNSKLNEMSVWQQVFETSTDATQFAFRMCYPVDTYPVYDNFELYELEKIPATITINYVDESGAEIDVDDIVITDKYVGDSYTTSLPASIVDNSGTTFVKVSEDTTLDWVYETNVINAVYKEDTIISADPVTGITTRVGILPALPATVTATLGISGGTMQAPVKWTMPDASEFVEGTVTVTGTVTDTVSVTATVTVLNKDAYLLAHYAFEDAAQTNGSTLADETVNEYVATVTGDDLSSVDGVIGNAINLDGTGYLTLSNDLTQAISDAVDAGEGFTMSTFVKKNVAQNQFLFSMHGTEQQAYERAYGLIDSAGNDALRFEGTKDYQATTPTRKMYAKSGTHANADSEFVHLAVTFDYTSGDGLGLIKFYLNGEDVTDTSRGVNLTDGKIDFTPSQVKSGSLDSLYTFVGLSPYPGDGNYNGYLDEFKIYSVALTADEVADLGAKHTTTVNYVTADGASVYTEDVTAWNGQTITLLSEVQDTNKNYYTNATESFVVDKAVDSIDVEVELDVRVSSITVQYMVGDVVVGTKEQQVNTNDNASIEESYIFRTEDEAVYLLPAYTEVVDATKTVQVNAVKQDNAGSVSGDVTVGDGLYTVTAGNLMANGDFEYGYLGWTAYGDIEKYWTLGDHKITKSGSAGGVNTASTIRRFVPVEPGTYYVTMKANVTTATDEWIVVGGTDKTVYENVNADGTARFVYPVDYATTGYSSWKGLVYGDGTGNYAAYSHAVGEETFEYIVTIPDDGAEQHYILFLLGPWTVDNAVTYSDFGVYKAVEKTVDYTVVYNWAGTTETATKSVNAVANIKGYNDEVIFPNVEIPYKAGYVFKNKTVSGSEGNYTVTLNYEATDTNAYFFDNVADDTTFVSLNMLGAHDAFTANLASSRKDAAAVAQGDSGAQGALTGLGFNKSKAQSADALTMLNSGVRYFDIRLSRSDKDATYLIYTAPHTNGVYYTTHGYLGEEFRPIAYTIAQWAKEHPGEIIVLDFQETYDYTGDHDGNALQDSEKAIDAILEEAGVKEFVTVSNGSVKGHTYGSLTNNGEDAGIVLFARNRETSYGAKDYATVGSFILRGTNDNAFVGKMYSNYDKDGATIGSTLDSTYIAAQVDHLNDYQTIDGDYENGDNPIVFMYRVMQAISDSSNLINQAATDNTFVTNAVKSNPTWLTALPVIMVNDAVTNTSELVGILQSCNEARETTINYVDGEGTVKSVTENLMVGTLYTGDVLGEIVSTDTADYYVSDDIHTKPYTKVNDVWTWTRTIIPVPYNSAITVNVCELGNVYSLKPYDGIVYTSNLTDDGAYKGGDNFAAFTWSDSTADRIGVGIFEATAGKTTYALSGEVIRRYGASTVKFYAVPFEAYDMVWRTDMKQVLNMLNEGTLVATVKTTDGMENTTQDIILDADVVSAVIGESGKVVIIGDARTGLFGLKGEGLALNSGNILTVDGTDSFVKEGTSYTVTPGTGAAALVDENNKIYVAGTEITPTQNMDLASYVVGLGMVKGAQVRIGQGVGDNGKVREGSGLRFIVMLETDNSLAQLIKNNASVADDGSVTYESGYGIGVRICAEDDTTQYADVDATKWQDAGESGVIVFTAAITNLSESNYNRKFVATPYVVIDGVQYFGNTYDENNKVVRSIYQVSAGLLASGYSSDDVTGDTENTEGSDTMSDRLVAVLNAYVNQVGVRLTLSDLTTEGQFAARTTGNGAYTGDAFFKVGDTSYADGKYTVELTTVGKAVIDTRLFNEYVRINNNNKAICELVAVSEPVTNDDGTLTYTLTFEHEAKTATEDETTAE